MQTDGATGSNAPGPGAGPGAPGGNAGRVLLRAGDGTLTVAQGVTAFGGRGGDPGGGFIPGAPGGVGGAVNVVARHVGALACIEAEGGDGSGPQDNAGPGGPGGAVRVWSDDGVLDGSRFVATSGGIGLPGGLEGAQTAEQSPADVTPSKRAIAFTLRSPDASRVGLVAVNGPQAGLLVSASGVSARAEAAEAGRVRRRALCGGRAWRPRSKWTSNPGAFVRGKSAKNRKCRTAPKVSRRQEAHRLGRRARARRLQAPRRRQDRRPRHREGRGDARQGVAGECARTGAARRPRRDRAPAAPGAPPARHLPDPAQRPRPGWTEGDAPARSRSRFGHEAAGRTTDGPPASRGELQMNGLHAARAQEERRRRRSNG